ncbi:hypothetical protein MUGA111182_10375 [Mucilaginibacter galii]|uniref:Uncharacterized protein n=1 Tax=Mucilaginibacter galii TaxID=2005073 RepID=A0A917JAV1_9SPHI|nr:hypothetical protein [Mucilaginibacter galii]GGI51075.1 hypothetical protein GCM10011425_22870 [Mucilaginibacter galii]
MVPFNLEFEFKEGQVIGTAEQLDQLTDTVGFMRYQIVAGERRSVICMNMEEEPPTPVTVPDAENQYEAIHYPEQLSDFDEDEVFTPEEVGAIAATIKAYNSSRALKFDQMHFDF